MANPAHVKILRRGAEVWNKWREGNPRTEIDLVGVCVTGLELPSINLRGLNLSGSRLMDNDFSGADFRDAHLPEVHLCDCVLNEADFSRAFAVYVNLSDAKLNRAKFQRTYFEYVNLSFAELKGADFAGVTMDATVFGDNDLSEVQGLETVHHRGPSTVGIDTILRSRGKIPEDFLRGCGVPEDFIIYMESLVGKPIELYSCFISYSSKDDDFAKRLHVDLQAQKVRCWFAPEDLKIGDKFRTRIDEAVRVHDKLLLVLSKNSVNSAWVEKEVETAFEKEHRQGGKPVLFPIRLDDAVVQTDQAWAADIRRTRHIGDFTHWKDHDAYQQAFQRLLRDLKAEQKAPGHELEATSR